MNEFDQFVKRELKLKYYIRYADDFVILQNDKMYLEGILLKISGFLEEKLKLQLHPDKVPEQLKDGNYYYFMGSTLRDQNGNSSVPLVYWNGSKFDRSARWLGHKWNENDRVVFLEK
jgi:hypothetical protein